MASSSQRLSVDDDANGLASHVFVERLVHLKGELSDAEFARRCGLPYTTLKRYLGGSLPGIDAALKIAEAFDVTVDWLAGRRPPSVPDQILTPHGSVIIPRYEVRVSAGSGATIVPSPDVSEYFTVGRDWLRRNLPPWAPQNAIVGVLEGSGDSMEPTIRDGDLIMVVQDVDWRVVERGGVFVLSLDHERLLLKRLQVMMNGDLKIISDNKAYEPETIPFDDLGNRVLVHGQVFFVGGKPRSL